MDLKLNDRIIEVRTAYALNRIYNYSNRKKFKEHMVILQCLVESIDEANKDRFLKLIEKSTYENIVGASKKEVYATFKILYDKTSLMASKMGYNVSNLYYKYRDLKDRDFINDKFIESLKPMLPKETIEMCSIINSFLDNFNYITGNEYYEHYDTERCMEIDFWLIYKTLYEVFNGSSKLETFLYKLCTILELDWNSIAYMIRNVYVIERLNKDQILGKKQFKQELFNIGYLKGYKKYELGNKLFGKNGKYYYTKSYEYMTKDITKDLWEFQLTFVPTLDWQNIKHKDILEFIRIFRDFVNEGL